MDIDMQVREILSRSFPVNDNNIKTHTAPYSRSESAKSCIYVVGDNNIIISSGLLMATTIAFFLSLYLIIPY